MNNFIPVHVLAKRLGISRGRIYGKIKYGTLKEGIDYKKEKRVKEILVVREDLKI